jgi:hypothetical protein
MNATCSGGWTLRLLKRVSRVALLLCFRLLTVANLPSGLPPDIAEITAKHQLDFHSQMVFTQPPALKATWMATRGWVGYHTESLDHGLPS